MQTAPKRCGACLVVLVGVLAGASSFAAEPPTECTTGPNGTFSVVADGPTSVACPDTGECTAMSYTITALAGSKPRYVSMLLPNDVVVASPTSDSVFAPCKGDRRARLGLNDCSRQTVRLEPSEDGPSSTFEIVVRGTRDAATSAIAMKRTRVEGCEIASLGGDAVEILESNALILTRELITFKGCTVSIPVHPLNGESELATVSGPNCVLLANALPVNNASLNVAGANVGNLTFGDGYVSSGTSSCTTKVISNRLYTWCTCADTNGDGVPEDPKPPCPARL